MKLYMKQKVFSWRDKFSIFDEGGAERYYAEGEIFTWGHKLRLFDNTGREAAFIKQKLLTFLPRYIIEIGGEEFTLVKEFTFFKQCFHIENCGWTIEGDFWAHEYSIKNGEEIILHISKHWFTWGDSYEFDIPDSNNVLLALSAALAIDCIQADQSRAASSAASR
ncbi:MAG: LURP-one-related family protein [Ruminococcus sp.]|nr:LURP-one-related family protein [Ruminococcus sp.]